MADINDSHDKEDNKEENEEEIITIPPENSNNSENEESKNKIICDFIIKQIIGEGTFATVRLAINRQTGEKVAIKIIEKNKISHEEDKIRMKREIEVLKKLRHPNIVHLYSVIDTEEKIYLITDYIKGIELFDYIVKKKKLTENESCIFFQQIISGIEYLHKIKYVHRDIKPENLIFDQNGYLHITDFGIAKLITKNNSHETSGTPGYMAPEVMQGLSHTFSVDFYAIGVIIYELMMGKRPYTGKTRKEIKEQIMGKQAKISKLEIPDGWSFEAADFANKLLVRKEVNRLGFYNENNIKEHPWLKDVDMDLIKNKKLKAPFLPKKNHDNYDKNYCEEEEEINIETMNRFEDYKLSKNYKNLFLGFTFYNINNIVANSNENNDIKNKTLVVYNKKNLNDNKFNSINHNNNYSSEKMNKSLKIIHQRYKSNIPNNINLEKNFNMNYSLSKIISRKTDHKLL